MPIIDGDPVETTAGLENELVELFGECSDSEVQVKEEADPVNIIVLSRAGEELTRLQVQRGTMGVVVRRTIAGFLGVPCDAWFQTALLDKHFFLLDDYKVMEDLRVQVGARARAG